ncbi:class I SAM-dependent methyltransferase [Sulfurospirillum diekertiae]|uniref:Methyltransferase domain-containing protein n=1 Tax=Sulfurospirillum diekertiae TaxID=1854492 RepID=A0A1Y0HPZ1_9BACT|nr:class I SAM-dependent methyltransferase [Sulfurospirillum diekertiae]ARU49616.1 hypothetical protein Sdiek1_2466 [Sulfurospirillum diekertiae]ASC94417.1 hypothetical protein Sdiek2_2411 [Sulfurospirillum diekertiae]
MQSVLDAQQNHWETMFGKNSEMFGLEASYPAYYATALFHEKGVSSLLELGAGQGRDTLFFAHNGLHVSALDYTQKGLDAIANRAKNLNLSLSLCQHDVRKPLPFEDASFDACFSHMLYCMPLSTADLEFLNGEICRILKPGGYNIYTVRHMEDSHYKQGIHRGEEMYEMGGFIVHFFSSEKVQSLTKGFELIHVEKFEEGGLPRKLFCVTLKKM